MNAAAKMDRAGRLAIPLQLRRELGLSEDSELLVRVEGNSLRIQTRESAIREVQERLQKYRKPGRSVVDEFLKERREEARREWEGE
jgi:bifunctional DNA-binding transcriptional regulator/antitoxin component of YhaV-PrlF toxin-antitoxin module